MLLKDNVILKDNDIFNLISRIKCYSGTQFNTEGQINNELLRASFECIS